MKCIDLFAGAGGLSEGFHRAGFDIVAHVERDHNACLTLKTRLAFHYLNAHDKIQIYKDYLQGKITRDKLYSYIPSEILNSVINEEINEDTIKNIFDKIDKIIGNDKIDYIVGGPPCQAYSLMGRAKDPDGMKNDQRNYLYKYYIKFLLHYQPKMFVFENVEGMLSAQKGQLFKQIQKEMKTAGYNIDYKILNAKDFGVLQNRRRVILIGWQTEIEYRYPEFSKLKQEYDTYNLFEDLPKLKSGESIQSGKYISSANECLRNLLIRNDWNLLTQHIVRPNNNNDLEIYRICIDVWNKERRRVRYNELPERLITHKNTKSFLDRFKVVPYEEISHTVVAHISKDGHYYIHPDIQQNRSLSVREAARIQSFPDDFYFESSRTAAFLQIGNAVPPLMAYLIAKHIVKAR